MVPAVVLYILCRLDVLPESPRFLYLVGKREEGYYNLLDMYDKEIWAFRRLKSAETHQKSIKSPSKDRGTGAPMSLLATGSRVPHQLP